MDLVECLGVGGRLETAPLSAVGWGAPVEMIGSVISLTLLPLSTVAGLVTLTIGVRSNIDCPFNWLKDSQEHELVFSFRSSSVVLQPEAQNEKIKTLA